MTRHGVPATPRNYAVWYEYVKGANPLLRAEVDNAIRRNEPFSPERNAEIYARFFEDEHECARKQEASDAIINDLQMQVKRAEEAADQYTQVIDEFYSCLTHERDVDRLGAELEQLRSETRGAARRHKALAERFTEAGLGLEALRKTAVDPGDTSRTDALTGLPNMRGFRTLLDQATARAERESAHLSLLLADINDFKSFNEKFGYVVGDRALRFIGNALKRCLKGGDQIARYESDCFAVILPNTGYTGARVAADQVREHVSSGNLRERSGGASYGRLSLSIGVAQYESGESASHLLRRAEESLGKAQHAYG